MADRGYISIKSLQVGSDEEEIRDAAKQIAEKKALLKKLSQSKNTLKNRPVLPRKTQHVSLKQFTTGMKQIGLDPKHLEKRAEKLVAKEKEAYEAFKAQNGGDDQDGMDVDEEAVAGPSTGTSKYTGRSRAIAERRAPRTDRRTGGLTTATQSAKADELERLGRRPAALFGRAGEGDRHVPDMKPKWVRSSRNASSRFYLLLMSPFLFLPTNSCTVERGRMERTTDDRLLASRLSVVVLPCIFPDCYPLTCTWSCTNTIIFCHIAIKAKRSSQTQYTHYSPLHLSDRMDLRFCQPGPILHILLARGFQG